MKRIFLVGCPRSGTTVLQSILASHSAVVSFPETHFFPSVVPRNRILRRLGIARWPIFTRWHAFRSTRASARERRLRIRIRDHVQDFVRVLDQEAAAQRATAWLEKTPRHLHFIDVIHRYIPDAIFLHLIRDGAEVATSLHRTTLEHPGEWRGSRSLKRCIRRWTEDVARSMQYRGVPSHHFVFFDELLSSPTVTVADICGQLGLEYEADMLERRADTARSLILPSERWKQQSMEARLSASNRLGDLSDRERRTLAEGLEGHSLAEIKRALRDESGVIPGERTGAPLTAR